MKKVPPVMITLYGICCLLWLIMTFTMVGRQIYPQNGMPEAFVFSEDWECDGQLYSMERISKSTPGHSGLFGRKKNAVVESAVLSIDSAEMEKRYKDSLRLRKITEYRSSDNR